MDLRVSRSSDVPLGVQLARRIRSDIASGDLVPGERLPSVREAAAAAGVNVNTVRSVYGRLEREGLLRSAQGSGTFVAAPASRASEAAERRALRDQIAALELELARRPPPTTTGVERAGRPRGAVLSADDLRRVRDDLMSRLEDLDAQRAELLRRLHELKLAELDARPAPRPGAATPSLANARVRWIGA